MKRKNKLISLFILGLVNACNSPNVENTIKNQNGNTTDETEQKVNNDKNSIPNISPSPEKSFSPNPVETSVSNPAIKKVDIRGNVYNVDGSLVDGAIITAKSVNSDITWSGQTQTTTDGYYLLKDVPVGTIQISATKEGWTTRESTLEVKDSSDNIFSFGDGIYAIQDAPEIVNLKVNGNIYSYSGLSGLNDDSLEIEIEFSEPVIKADIENYLKISSQDFGDRDKPIINKYSKGTSFTWSEDDKKVVFKSTYPLANKEQEKEVSYTIELTSPFHDRSGKAAITTKYYKTYGGTSDIFIFSLKNKITEELRDLSTFMGTVYDINHNIVKEALITARSIDPNINWVGKPQLTIDGKYSYRGPTGARIQITATKDGLTTRDRSEVIRYNDEDASTNRFNFGSDSINLTVDSIYAIQNEPEISLLKINGKRILSAFNGDSFNGTIGFPAPTSLGLRGLASDSFKPSLYGLSNTHLEIEMTFSEPVIHRSVEDSFKVSSQDFEDKSNLILNKKSEGVSFTWSTDDKICTFKYDKPLVANKEGNEARYIINFTSPFSDLNNKEAIPYRYFRFSTSQINDFATFSVKNVTE